MTGRQRSRAVGPGGMFFGGEELLSVNQQSLPGGLIEFASVLGGEPEFRSHRLGGSGQAQTIEPHVAALRVSFDRDVSQGRDAKTLFDKGILFLAESLLECLARPKIGFLGQLLRDGSAGEVQPAFTV